ncbi:MAG TPA: hypothetical protein VNL14_16745 [Candidatus Acidoferrales bacterium]|nr:hypothetical protein [Candidatus Acidoferrales bacterium]
MSLQTQVSNFNTGTGTGTLDVSTNFTPSLVIFANPTTDSADEQFGIGACAVNPTDDFVAGIANEHNTNTTDANRYFNNAACVLICLASGAPRFLANLQSFNSSPTGFTLNRTTSGVTSGQTGRFVALAGEGVDFKVLTIDVTTSVGEQSFSVGFRPVALILVMTRDDTTAGNEQHARFLIGFGDAQLNQACVGYFGEDAAAAADEYVTQRTDRIIRMMDAAGTVEFEATLQAMTNDGFTLNVSNAPSATTRIGVIALGGSIHAKVDKIDLNTVTGNQDSPDNGFRSALVFFASFGLAAATTVQNAGRQMFGVGMSSGSRWVRSISADHAADPTAVSDADSATRCVRIASGAGTLQTDADFVSHNDRNFTINVTTANGTSREVIYLAIGEARSLVPDGKRRAQLHGLIAA